VINQQQEAKVADYEPSVGGSEEWELSKSAASALKEVAKRIQDSDAENFRLKAEVRILRAELENVIIDAGMYAAKCASIEAEFTAYRNERSGLTAAKERASHLVSILLETEWVTDSEGFVSCPSCKRLRLHGHSQECTLAKGIT
jgi:hypothetical protein